MAETTPALPVLMYHSVGGPMPPDLAELSVPAATLAAQLALLDDEGYRLLGLTDALAAHARGERVAALTFDDGYRDFLDAGVPVLRAAGAGATLYVPTRNLGATASWLPSPADRLPILGAGDLHAVVAAGVEVGSHGARHVPMDVIDPRAAAGELAESRAVLEDAAGVPVRSFCYPHGYHAGKLRRLVVAAGYENACAIGHRLHPVDGDRLAVQRVLVGPDHTPERLRELVRHGPDRLRPAIKRLATPGWRLARRTALRTRGVTWT